MGDDGLVADWNQAIHSSSVQVGDRIVEVNGRRGDAQDLLRVVQSEDVLQMVVQQCRVEAPAPEAEAARSVPDATCIVPSCNTPSSECKPRGGPGPARCFTGGCWTVP